MTKKIALFAAIMAATTGLAHIPAARAQAIDVIAVRQTAMALETGSFGYIRSVVAAKGDVKPLENPAKAIARWATLMPTMFPAGSDKGGNTKALPEIWTDKAGFEKVALAAADAATKLSAAAKAGDAEEVAVQTKALGEQCGACHRGYRAK